ncbi:pseudouridine synthase [Aquabacterium sp.]|uniref:pseudouridine synthase n=1 Tax=Aquabacterium sp. TaxID=1872578 RepID=UPI0025C5B439|nr:pseudouridine synthase [Aquabacterium sp.]
MTERKKLSLNKPHQAEPGHAPATPFDRKPPVRGSAAVPRKRMTAAEAAQAREEAAARNADRARQAALEALARGEREHSAPPAGRREWGDRPERGPRTDRRSQGPDRGPRRDDRRSPYGTQGGFPDAPRAAPPRQHHRRADGTQGHATQAPAPEATQRQAPDDGRIRLSKLMSERGLASRREADEWIEQGWVRVNGEVVDELGTRVAPDVEVSIDPLARTQQAERVTILIHKPIGYVSGQAEDGYEPAAVLIRPENRWSEDKLPLQLTRGHLRQLAPSGRLDIDSTGLLVLTQDGRIAKALIGEDSGIEKEYLVRVESVDHPGAEDVSALVPPEVLEALRFGLELDGRQLKPAQVSWQNESQLRFVLREGRKRQIRRMCELVGLHVIGLKRVRMGRIALGKLPLGQWRFLRPDERF